jgi:hypothetical protein
MTEFIKRLAPNINESSSSYLYRLTKENFLPSLSYIASDMGISVPKITNNDIAQNHLDVIANLTRVNPTLLEKMTINHWSSQFGNYSDKVVIKNRVKFCPECILEEHYHQVSWCFYPLNICLKHLVILVDQCGYCGGKIILESLMKGFCPVCQHVYNKSNCAFINSNTTFYQSQLYLAVRFFGPLPVGDWFQSLSLSNYIELAFRSLSLLQSMRSYIDPTKKINGFYNKRDAVKESSEIADAFSNVNWIYQDFPNRFFKMLDDFQIHKQNQLRYVQKAKFELLFQNERFSQLQTDYERYWIEQLDQGKVRSDLSVFKKKPSLLDERHHIGIEEVRGEYGLTTQKIHRLTVSQPSLQSKTVHGKYSRYLIPIDKLEIATKEYRSYITKGGAAQILGIQKDSIPKLIQAGLLICHKTEYADKGMLNHSEVESLLRGCRGKYVANDITGIRFHDALIKFSINGLSIIRMIEFTQSNKLNPLCSVRNGSLADNYYNLVELEECVNYLKEERRSIKGYNMTEVMKLIGVGEKNMWRIVNEGFLVPDHINFTKDGRKHYYFRKEKVLFVLERKIELNQLLKKLI